MGPAELDSPFPPSTAPTALGPNTLPARGSPYTATPVQSSATSTPSRLPCLLVPNITPMPLLNDMNKRPKPSFPIPIRQQPGGSGGGSSQGQLSMSPEDRLQQALGQSKIKGPQHKHAHHLHSIPPREKTTRTLILDHMLWLHARARFDQARAELGVAEETEDEEPSDPVSEPEDGYGEKRRVNERDALNARAAKAKADGLEKVLSAMLEQPPEDLPFDPDDLLFKDTSFTAPTPQLLPNGVRLRLALAGLINDVFGEDEYTNARSTAELQESAFYQYPTPPLSVYTPALATLAGISSFSHHSKDVPSLPSFHSFTNSAQDTHSPAQSIMPPAGSIFSSIPRGAGPESPWALGGSLGSRHGSFAGSSSAAPPPRVFRAVGRAKDLYNAGTQANPNRAGGIIAPPAASSSSSTALTVTFDRPRRCPHHLTYTCPPSSFCIMSLSSQSSVSPTTKAPKSRLRSSIGAGLSSSGPPLRRGPFFGRSRGKECVMTDLIPRFLRLSALVAVELGREAKGEEDRAEEVGRLTIGSKRKESFSMGRARAGSGIAAGEPGSLTSNASYESDEDGSKRWRNCARPTRLWYKLLAGLLTRAVLQGYLVKGWRGTDPIEILMGVGMGAPPSPVESQPSPTRSGKEKATTTSPMDEDDEDAELAAEEEKEFEPDEMPDLVDVWPILFGFKSSASSSMTSPTGPTTEPYEEYERVMGERISEFFTIPPNCSDLAMHLDDLAHKYPSQPVDRAVLRFCEAVARWRGRPELENYKTRGDEPGGPSLSIHTLIHPQPSPKPLIERYFAIPTKAERAAGEMMRRRDSVSSMGGTKRGRRESWTDPKGKKALTGQAWMEEDEYVGPYGI